MLHTRSSIIDFGDALRRGGAFILGAGCVIIVGAAAPAQIARLAVRVAAATPIACSVTGTSACLIVTNASSGIAVNGTSKSGTGLRGSSTSNFGLKATSTSNYGIYGQSSSGAAAVFGTMKNKIGILGADTGHGIGVEGTAVGGGNEQIGDGFGVVGSSKGTAGIGVVGFSTGGVDSSGVDGSSNAGTGVTASTLDGTGLFAFANGRGEGIDVSTNGGTAFAAESSSGIGAQIVGSTFGIIGRAATNGLPLVIQDTSANNLFYVDGSGNVSYRGSLQSFARMRGGGSATAFGPKATAPTLEDTGTAHLASGSANVTLDAVFAATIDTKSVYRVFITPNGDSHGLYVASKSPAGFVVRESQGGRSSLDFDYRIVAVAIGHGTDRMSLSRAAGPTVPASARFARRTMRAGNR